MAQGTLVDPARKGVRGVSPELYVLETGVPDCPDGGGYIKSE